MSTLQDGLSQRSLECEHSADSNGSQPGGLADGSRWSLRARGERPPEKGVGLSSTPEGRQIEPRRNSHSGTPPGCKTSPAPLPGGRRPNKPSATSGYRLAIPSGCLIQNFHTPVRFPSTSWSVDIVPAQVEANPEGCQTVAG